MATWQTTVDAAERAETDTADIASYLRKDRKQLLRNNPEGSSRSTRRKAQRRMSCMY